MTTPFSTGAFTLIEVVIVIGLLGLMAAVAFPVVESRSRAAQLPESAERVRSALFMARNEAMMLNRRVRVRLPPAEPVLVEVEPDPFTQPGYFEPLDTDWTQEEILLGDVMVHEVRTGRPVWLIPVDTAAELTAPEDVAAAEMADVPVEEIMEASDDVPDLVEPEDTVPTILFEPDGRAEWATVVLSRRLPEEPLDERDEQAWVLVDGRTGLARLQEQVTQERLADPAFAIDREKLELPILDELEDALADLGQAFGGGLGAFRPGVGPGAAGRGEGIGLPGGAAAMGGEFGNLPDSGIAGSIDQPIPPGDVVVGKTEAGIREEIERNPDLTEEQRKKLLEHFNRK